MESEEVSLEDFRSKHELSQQDLSKITGISKDKISKFERSLYELSSEELEKIKNAINLSRSEIDEILEGKRPVLSSDRVDKFEKDGHTIYWGDALKVLETEIPDGSVDLIFVDPPYNIGKRFEEKLWETKEDYLEWCYQWIDLCIDKLNETGSMYIMAATQFMPYIDQYIRDKLKILSRIIWHYDSSGRQAKNYFGSLYEPILHCVKNEKDYVFNADDILVEAKTGAKRKLIDYRKDPPQPYNTKKVPGNVWQIPRVRYRMDEYEKHPSQKPEKLMRRIILASSNKNDIVLDPFSGTFTTSAIAKKCNRKSIGIEIHEEYVKIGLRRLEIQDHFRGEPINQPTKTYNKNSAYSQNKE